MIMGSPENMQLGNGGMDRSQEFRSIPDLNDAPIDTTDDTQINGLGGGPINGSSERSSQVV